MLLRRNEIRDFSTSNSRVPFINILLILLSIVLLAVSIASLVVINNLLNKIILKENEILDNLNAKNYSNHSMYLDGHYCQKNCTPIMDRIQIIENYTLYCSTNQSIYNNFIFFINDLEDKIAGGYILKTSICVNNIIVYGIMKNMNKTFPAPNSSVDDQFINGLPNICGPGTNHGHVGNSIDFFDSAISFINTIPFNTTTVIHYDHDSIHAYIGESFLNGTKLEYIPCFYVEVYCYGFEPLYLYTPQI